MAGDNRTKKERSSDVKILKESHHHRADDYRDTERPSERDQASASANDGDSGGAED